MAAAGVYSAAAAVSTLAPATATAHCAAPHAPLPGIFPVSSQSHEISSLRLPRIILSAAQVRLSCHTFMCVKVKPDDINISFFS